MEPIKPKLTLKRPIDLASLQISAMMQSMSGEESASVIPVVTPLAAANLSPLLRLPREIRDEIYYFALLDPTPGESSSWD